MSTTTISIQGTFDIALGRKTLRSKIDAQSWKPTFNARSAAALTALGELILLTGTNGSAKVVPVNVRIMAEGRNGVELSCQVDTTNMDRSRLAEAQQRLAKATDELHVKPASSYLQITACIWC